MEVTILKNRTVYVVNVHGTEVIVTVTATPSVVRRWIRSRLFYHRYFTNRNRLIVGLGVQWTLGGSDSPADTLQLCIGCRCLIFQLAHAGRVPQRLRNLLRNPDHTFVGFWNHSDRRKLESSVHKLKMCRDPLDLRLHVKTKNDESLAQASVDEIVEECLGYQLGQSAEFSMTGWNRDFLDYAQVVYACVDAHSAFQIGKAISAWSINRLLASFHRIRMWRNPLDLRLHVTSRYGNRHFSMAHTNVIVHSLLGFSVYQTTAISMSQWNQEYLSDDQVVFACVDAYCAYEIGRRIRAWRI